MEGKYVDHLCKQSDHELRLKHARYNSSEWTEISCEYGCILGRIVGVENNTYTSQLTVNLTSDTFSVTRNSIECMHT